MVSDLHHSDSSQDDNQRKANECKLFRVFSGDKLSSSSYLIVLKRTAFDKPSATHGEEKREDG